MAWLARWLRRAVLGAALALLLGTILVGLWPDELPPTRPPTPVRTALRTPPALSAVAADLQLRAAGVQLSQTLAEGAPITFTLTVENTGAAPAGRVQALVQIVRPTADGEQNMFVGSALAAGIAAGDAITMNVAIPPLAPFRPGVYRYYASANLQGYRELSVRNNFAPVGELRIGPPLARCLGPPDLSLAAADVALQRDSVVVTPRNRGPQTVYDVAVRLRYTDQDGLPEQILRLPRLLPCGGGASVTFTGVRSSASIEVNPAGLAAASVEQDHSNNLVQLPLGSQGRR